MLKRLLITGANGNLGSVCRDRLTHIAQTLRVSDFANLGPARENEEVVHCDLGDKAGVEALVDGCDGIIHMGAQALEAPWDVIRNSNIDGIVNLFEAARKSSVKPRIVYASSNHVVGYHKVTDRLDDTATMRPDGLYGASKVFGEAIASMYHHKFGIETASLRIGSCYAAPKDHRMLSTWLSHDDLIGLIERIYAVERLGNPVIYGVSANSAGWWDNPAAEALGWTPKDNSERFREEMNRNAGGAPSNPAKYVYQGGPFCEDGIHES